MEAFLATGKPPPPRPVLVIVDYSPLQELTHRSQPDHALYSALASSNFRNVSAGELEALSPGHVYLNQSKQAFSSSRSSHRLDNAITHPVGHRDGIF